MRRALVVLVSLVASVGLAFCPPKPTEIKDLLIKGSLQLAASSCTGTDAVCSSAADGLKIAGKVDGTVCICSLNGSTWEWQAVTGAGGTASAAYSPPSVVIYPSGSDYVAVKSSDTSFLYSGSDPGLAVQAAIDAYPTGGATIDMKAGTYIYTNTIPTVKPGYTNWLTISAYGANIVLSATAHTALSAAKSADGDVFQYVRFLGARVDATADVTGAINIFGAYGLTRTSWKHIDLEDLSVTRTNGAVQAGAAAIAFGNYSVDTNDTTAMVVEDVTIRNIDIFGGCYGIRLSSASALGYPNSNFDSTYDRISVSNITSDLSDAGANDFQPAFLGCTAGVHIGGYAVGKAVDVSRVTCKAAGDNCIEIDGAEYAHISDVNSYNHWIDGFTFKNLSSKIDVAKQRYVCERCNSYITAVPPTGAAPYGFSIITNQAANSATYSFGELAVKDSSFISRGVNSVAPTPFQVQSIDGATGLYGLRGLSIDGYNVEASGAVEFNFDTFWTGILWTAFGADRDGDGTRDLPDLRMRNFKVALDYTHTNGNSYNKKVGYIPLFIKTGQVNFDIADFSVDADIDGTVNLNDYIFGMSLGVNGSTTTGGTVRNYRFAPKGNMNSGSFAIVDYGSEKNTVRGYLSFYRMDTTGISNSAVASDFSFAATSNLPNYEFASSQFRFYADGTVSGSHTTPLGDLSAPNVTATANLALTGATTKWSDPGGDIELTYDGASLLQLRQHGSTTYQTYFYPETGAIQNNCYVTGACASPFYTADIGASVTGNPTVLKANLRSTTPNADILFQQNDSTKRMFLRYVGSTGDFRFVNNSGTTMLSIPNAASGTFQSDYAENFFSTQVTSPLVRIKETNQSYYMTHKWDGGVVANDQTITWNIPDAGCGAYANGGALNATGTGGNLTIACTDDDSGAGGGGSGNVFLNVHADSGADSVADSTSDTLNLTGTAPLSTASTPGTDTITFAIANAAADGATKGAATFTAADFDAASGVISLDYTNGQAAATGAKGFLTSADWNTFNGKVGTLAGGTGSATGSTVTIAGGTGITTSGASSTLTVALDQAVNATWTGKHSFATAEILGATPFRFEGATDNNFYVQLAVPDVGATVTLTLPNITDTLVTKNTTDTLKNKTMEDSTFLVADDADTTKKVALQVSGVHTATTRTLTVPDKNGIIAVTTDISTSTGTTGATYNIDSDSAAVAGDGLKIGTDVTALMTAAVGSGGTLAFNVPISSTGDITTACDPTTSTCRTIYRHNNSDVASTGVDSTHSAIGFDSNGNAEVRGTNGVGGLWGGAVCTRGGGSISVAGCGIVHLNSTEVTAITGAVPKVYVFICDGTSPSITASTTFRIGTSFNCTADDTLTMAYDGTNWFQLSRATN